MFGLTETAGAFGAFFVFVIIIIAIYLLILAILMPYFVFRMYQDIAEIKKHMLGIAYDINAASTKIKNN